MNLNFKIHQNYLLTHILRSKNFSDSKYEKDLVALKNKAWDISTPCYNILIGRFWHPFDHSYENYRELERILKRKTPSGY